MDSPLWTKNAERLNELQWEHNLEPLPKMPQKIGYLKTQGYPDSTLPFSVSTAFLQSSPNLPSSPNCCYKGSSLKLPMSSVNLNFLRAHLTSFIFSSPNMLAHQARLHWKWWKRPFRSLLKEGRVGRGLWLLHTTLLEIAALSWNWINTRNDRLSQDICGFILPHCVTS